MAPELLIPNPREKLVSGNEVSLSEDFLELSENLDCCSELKGSTLFLQEITSNIIEQMIDSLKIFFFMLIIFK
ncbi:hypothetical protein D3C83_52410 [compost metagenome]